MVYENREDRLIKKAKTVFKALKKGTIGPKDDPNEPRFKYELSDNITIDRNNVGIILTTDKIKIIELNRACRLTDVDYMGSLIRKRFSHFGIVLTSPYGDRYFNYEVDPSEPETLNEHGPKVTSSKVTPQQAQKVRSVYSAFKTGILKHDFSDSRYKYVLPNDYYITLSDDGELCAILTMNPEEDFKLYSDVWGDFKDDSYLRNQVNKKLQPLIKWAQDRVKNKFKMYDIRLVF